jgi:hypothetical protein
MTENEKIIENAAVLRDGKKKLTCTEARQLAKKHNISLKEVGDTCNNLGIKITDCELGCFK